MVRLQTCHDILPSQYAHLILHNDHFCIINGEMKQKQEKETIRNDILYMKTSY